MRTSLPVVVLAVSLLSACGGNDDGAASEATASTAVTTTSREVTTTRRPTTTRAPTSTAPPTQRVPTVRWRPFAEAAENLDDADLSAIVAGLDAQEVVPGDDWLVVGASKADPHGNVGLTVASPDQLGAGVRVDLWSDTNLLYASIRKARQDVWAFARMTGDDPVRAANRCAGRVRDAIDGDDVVVLCYVYDNRDRFEAEGRNEAAESSTGLVCARAYGTADGDSDPYGQDLGFGDPGCPEGESDTVGTGIERVPLPQGGSFQVADDGTGGPADADARSFSVPGVTLDQLVAFYDSAMAPGAPWRGWPWCESHEELDEVNERIWFDRDRSGTGLLRVSLLTDPESGPTVVVARHGQCQAANS